MSSDAAPVIPSATSVDTRLTLRIADRDFLNKVMRAAEVHADETGGAALPPPFSFGLTLSDLDAAAKEASAEIALLRRQKKISDEQAEIIAKLDAKAWAAVTSQPPAELMPSKPEPETVRAAEPPIAKAPTQKAASAKS